MTDVQEFCLRWNNHQSNLVTAFHNLRLDHDFLDVTLACDGQNLQAHKVVLSACSPFFRDVLKTTPCKHPVIILRDISYFDLAALVEFMYQGEVRIGHDGLPSFLRTAEVLKVKGLADDATLRQKAISQQLADGQHQAGQNDNQDISGTAAGTQHISEISVRTEVKLEDTTESPKAAHAEYTESALTDSFEDDVIEDQATHQPSLTLQSFARIQSALPPVIFNGVPGELPSETMDNQDFSGIGLGTSRDPQSPHECPYCNRRICNLYALRRHIRDRHNTQNSVFPCDLCGRTYRTKNSLTTHRSVKHRPPPASSPTSLHTMRFQAKDDHVRMIYN